MTFRFAAGLMLLTLGGCVPSRSRPPAQAAHPVPAPHAPRPGTPPGLDNEESLWPDPLIRTHVRLSALQHVIDRHERAQGTLPTSLRQIIPEGREGPVVWEHDAWGYEIRYVLLAGDYELRAPGPDGLIETADDIVARRGTELPMRVWEPGSRTATIMGSLESLTIVYHRRNGAFPENLETLGASGLQPYLGTRDEWGNLIRYLRTRNGFELRSAGPDGSLSTPDDMVVHRDASSTF